MKAFANLYQTLDRSNQDGEKLAALKDYFSRVAPEDAAWAIFFLSGRRLKTGLKSSQLRLWAQEWAGVSKWLFDECYQVVGDLGETTSLILPPPSPASLSVIPLHQRVALTLEALSGSSLEQQHQLVKEAWQSLDPQQRIVFNKLATDSFRVSVSARLLLKAVSEWSGLDLSVTAQRLKGNWEPSAEFFKSVCQPDTTDSETGRPYPFFLAQPLADTVLGQLQNSNDWLAEWMWDGKRAQLVKRRGQVSIWSKEQELLGERLPELTREAALLDDGIVLDGEILAWKDSDILPFHLLQKRLSCQNPTSKILKEIPVIYMAFDLLEENGCDIRSRPIEFRLERLADRLSTRAQVVGSPDKYQQLKLFAPCKAHLSTSLRLSPLLHPANWKEMEALRNQARKMKVEGLMLKRKGSSYGQAAPGGDWWKWKTDPLKVDAVLVAAQADNSSRAGLFSNYTFALWHNGELLSFARADSELPETEVLQLDAFVRENTLSRYGPVCTVKPELVFELHCRGIQPSLRYKSGVAARSCRVLRWRRDLSAREADLLSKAREWLP